MAGGGTAIRVDDVSKRFVLRRTRSLKELAVYAVKGRQLSDTFLALDGLSLTVEEGETVGLLGLNGSGKSTLLKLISGVLRPDTGSVRVRGRTAGLIEVGAGLHPDLTGRENVYLNGAILGMSEADVTKHFDSIVDFSGIEQFLDTEVKYYSSGMFLRLAFAVVAVLVSGLGLLMAALNVYFRDFENIVDLLLIVVVWMSPVLYPWRFAQAAIGPAWLEQLYLANPLTVAAQLFQRAFWYPGATATPEAQQDAVANLIPDLFARGIIALLVGVVVLALGQLAFSRLEGRFAQEL